MSADQPTTTPAEARATLRGRVAVITGASSGIGLAIAEALADEGMLLVVNARRRERLVEWAARKGAHVVAGDITDSALPDRLLAEALRVHGRCDVVLNNAGCIEAGTIESIDLDAVSRMVRVNVEAAFRVAYVFARHFKKQGSGHLVSLSSVLGTKVRVTAGAYAGTKHAIEALSEALRMELAGTGVHVVCIEPGLVLTELHDHWAVHPRESLGIPHPLTPADVARAVIFVLSQPPHVRIPRLMLLPGDHGI
jgi:NADP-dependent 3-hydroxy acid dehydrogenase YdfG